MSLGDLFQPLSVMLSHGCVRAYNYYNIISNILNIQNFILRSRNKET